ncbi:MAG: PspC domain-containing protein [Bacteroidales bacterium]
MEQQKRLYRSRYDSVIAGISGGLGEYLNVDPLIIRILFVVLTIFGFGGLILYIILWIAIPLDPDFTYHTYHHKKNIHMENQDPNTGDDYTRKNYPEYKPKNDGNLIAGVILITLGAMFLVDRFIPRIDFGDLWPVLLIVAGIIIMKNSISKPKSY